MAKTKKRNTSGVSATKTNKMDTTIAGEIVDIPVTNVLKENYMPYAMSVIVSRALPQIDGFKPSHVKILYTMYKNGWTADKPRKKSATIAGASMEYNPHSDASNYETMIRLSTDNESLILPYVDNKGNVGKHYSRDMAYAASRYTEARLMPICKELFSGLSKNAVDMIDNYDNTQKEPTMLPVTFPSILVNANLGIAVGMASNICSFNLSEICAFTSAYIKNKKTDIFDYIKGPDFATGGEFLFNKEELQIIFDTGFGTLKTRGTYVVDEKKKHIEIKSIPYSTTIEVIIDDIIEKVSQNKIQGIKDVRDESDKNGLKITIDYKNGFDPKKIMNEVMHYTHLQDTFGCNFNVLIDGHPRVLGVKDILDEWIKWRKTCVKRMLQYDLEKNQSKLHLLEGLTKIILNIDKVIKIIKNTEKDKDVISNLMIAFKIDEIQATYIADMKLRNINKEYFLNKTKDIKKIEAEIVRLTGMISSDKKIMTFIAKELDTIKDTYGQPRKTKVVDASKVNYNISTNADEVKDYDVNIIVSEHGYIKKVPSDTFDANSEIKKKDDDTIVENKLTTNKSEILVFSNKAIVYKIRGFELLDSKQSDFGEFIPSLCKFEADEKIIKTVITNDFKTNLLFVFENGKVAKIPLSAYETKTKRTKLINAYSTLSAIISIFEIDKDQDFLLETDDDKAIIFNSSLINLKTTKSSQGAQTIRLNKNIVTNAKTIDSKNSDKTKKKLIAKNIPMSGKKK